MKLYLSRLCLNQRSKRAMSEMMHPYEMHRTLMRAFPDFEGDPRAEYGVLFRAEAAEREGAIKVFVQSLVEPDWSFLAALEDYLDYSITNDPYQHKDIMPYCSKIREGDIFTFRLRANPTKRVGKKDDPLHGKRVELNREEEQLKWLARKGQEREKDVPGGFEIGVSPDGHYPRCPNVIARTEGKVKGQKRVSETGHSTTHLAVVFEGVLRVTDSDAFRETLVRGIGSAKAFGFGLLSLAPAGCS
jgi:CRISPR system Cascade subunit CasE